MHVSVFVNDTETHSGVPDLTQWTLQHMCEWMLNIGLPSSILAAVEEKGTSALQLLTDQDPLVHAVAQDSDAADIDWLKLELKKLRAIARQQRDQGPAPVPLCPSVCVSADISYGSPDDLALGLYTKTRGVVLTSREVVLEDAMVDAALQARKEHGAPEQAFVRKPKKLELSVLDFAGQVEMYATHSLLLPKASVVSVVVGKVHVSAKHPDELDIDATTRSV